VEFFLIFYVEINLSKQQLASHSDCNNCYFPAPGSGCLLRNTSTSVGIVVCKLANINHFVQDSLGDLFHVGMAECNWTI
jgi:hypothetical protein